MRTFLSVSPDPATQGRIAEATAGLRASHATVRWVREPQLHVTLAFLGEQDEGQLAAVIAATRPAVEALGAFTAQVSGCGAFPGWSRPRVVWLGFADPAPVQQLGDAVRAACATTGWKPDGPFTPHLTLGRARQPLTSAGRRALRRDLEAAAVSAPFLVDRVQVMHSVLGRGGAEHREVASLWLAGSSGASPPAVESRGVRYRS